MFFSFSHVLSFFFFDRYEGGACEYRSCGNLSAQSIYPPSTTSDTSYLYEAGDISANTSMFWFRPLDEYAQTHFPPNQSSSLAHLYDSSSLSYSVYTSLYAYTTRFPCSNGGRCNRRTGKCRCESTLGLFEGDSCQLMQCQQASHKFYDKYHGEELGRYDSPPQAECAGAGVCLSMSELSAFSLSPFPSLSINGDASYSMPWDAKYGQYLSISLCIAI